MKLKNPRLFDPDRSVLTAAERGNPLFRAAHAKDVKSCPSRFIPAVSCRPVRRKIMFIGALNAKVPDRGITWG
jgi:hypothetical protein